MPDIEYLKKLALRGAVNKTIKISSSEFQRHVDASSKTAARKLKRLEEDRLIERTIVPGGQLIKMTEKGLEILKNEYSEYKQIFSSEIDSSGETVSFELEGSVLTGLGEGQYSINIPGYRKQFEEQLHFVPFPGTLNVQLSEESSETRSRLSELPSLPIHGFSDGERTYGGGKCYPVKIDGTEAALVVPERTHYPDDLIEVIAPVRLREALDLKDGDHVKIRIDRKEMEKKGIEYKGMEIEGIEKR